MSVRPFSKLVPRESGWKSVVCWTWSSGSFFWTEDTNHNEDKTEVAAPRLYTVRRLCLPHPLEWEGKGVPQHSLEPRGINGETQMSGLLRSEPMSTHAPREDQVESLDQVLDLEACESKERVLCGMEISGKGSNGTFGTDRN